MPISSSKSNTDLFKREMKSHGSLNFPIACYYANVPKESIPFHWHEELEFIYVEKGSLFIFAGTEKMLLKKGEGIFINSDIIHTIEAAGKSGATANSIVFHPRLIASIKNFNCWDKYIHPLINNSQLQFIKFSNNIDWHKNILSRIQIAWNYIAYDNFGYELRVRNELSEIILLIIENGHLQQTLINKKDLKNNERLKIMLHYIHSNYFDQISLDDIIKVSQISKSACLRIFHDILNTTPINYVNQYRLLVAAQHLEETDWLISEIGSRCGYSEMGYFSAQFKKKFGLTPKEYRNSISKK